MTRFPTGASRSTGCNADTGDAGCPDREGGFLLIAVVWVLIFLSLAVIAFSLSVRSHVQEASAEAASAQAAALAEAGVGIVISDIVNAQWDRAWRRRFPADLTPRTCRIEAGRVTIEVSDEAGRVDINAAGEELLHALLGGSGADTETARSLTAAILDWRDAGDTARPGGAEADDYERAGLPAPRNAPFQSVEELARVIGMNDALLERLRPLVTVHSGLSGVDANAATPQVIAALTSRPGTSSSEPLATSSRRRLPAAFSAPSPQRVFRIVVSATGLRGATFVRQAIVRAVPGRGAPFVQLDWGRGRLGGRTDPIDLGDC